MLLCPNQRSGPGPPHSGPKLSLDAKKILQHFLESRIEKAAIFFSGLDPRITQLSLFFLLKYNMMKMPL